GAPPQSTVGQLGRVARIRAAVAREPGLAVCGAAYDGIGIPACIATGSAAATQVLRYLRESRPAGVTGGHGMTPRDAAGRVRLPDPGGGRAMGSWQGLRNPRGRRPRAASRTSLIPTPCGSAFGGPA